MQTLPLANWSQFPALLLEHHSFPIFVNVQNVAAFLNSLHISSGIKPSLTVLAAVL
jgi:hypothetical protein